MNCNACSCAKVPAAFSVQVFIKDTAVITERCSLDDAADVADQAARVFGIFGSAEAQLQCQPPKA